MNMAWLWFKISAKERCEHSFDSLFSSYLLNMVGNGGNVLFWFEPWLDEKLLKDKFTRLLSLAINKHE